MLMFLYWFRWHGVGGVGGVGGRYMDMCCIYMDVWQWISDSICVFKCNKCTSVRIMKVLIGTPGTLNSIEIWLVARGVCLEYLLP